MEMGLISADAPAVSGRSARIIAASATLYYRHNDSARALTLGVMAMRYGENSAQVVMLVASCFLKVGDAEQAEAALTRLVADDLTETEHAAALFLEAKIAFRKGDDDGARRLMEEAASFVQVPG